MVVFTECASPFLSGVYVSGHFNEGSNETDDKNHGFNFFGNFSTFGC